MTFNDFISKWNGKYCEAGGSAGAENQCVDLANQYIAEFLNQPKILWTNACDFPLKAGDKYEFITNSPTNMPTEGDIVVWKSPSMPYGHVAIAIEANVNTFKSFDQNWPGRSPCHIQGHNYSNVWGWLRFKKPVVQPTPEQTVPLSQYQQDMKVWQDNFNSLRANLDQLKGEYSELLAKYEENVKKLSDANKKIDDLKSLNQLMLDDYTLMEKVRALISHIAQLWTKR